MKHEYKKIKISAVGTDAEKAAEIFRNEIEARTGVRPEFSKDAPDIRFVADSSSPRDGYIIEQNGEKLTFKAFGIRGLIFATGMFLRKIEVSKDRITLIEDIGGEYIPDKRIRGHQLGYRPKPNSYDAWTLEDYRRYYLDLMFFGCNTVEHIPYDGLNAKRNSLMKYDTQDFLVEAAKIADEYDLDVSLWYPNDKESIDEGVERRKRVFDRTPRIDAVFPPGGDPGDYPADEFIKRCREYSSLLKEYHPSAQMWPSSQAPHSVPNWGEGLIKELEKLPDEIDGVIMGPNHAFELDELRRRVPQKYPLRFYPDITHNLRCEYPVHFDRNDWHYALATGLSRECTNPRPCEYRELHRRTRRYVIGSVSYSEGITDDVNKCVWSDMDFFPEVDVRDTLEDYSRLYFPSLPAQEVADRILGLELNWQTDPAENPCIDDNLSAWEALAKAHPDILENWRFNQCLFRAKCDAYLRHKRIVELKAVKKAKSEILSGRLNSAKELLLSAHDERSKQLRDDIEQLAKKLFEQIGLQTDVERYGADGWERGAVLETIDLPTTDRAWFLGRLENAEKMSPDDGADYMIRSVRRNEVESDEYYFSLAEHGLGVLGCEQVVGPEGIYMNFQGDCPSVNNGTLPTCLFNVFDNQSFRFKLGGFSYATDYELKVTYKQKKNDNIDDLTVTANGTTVYRGKQFGDEDESFTREMLPDGFTCAVYQLPKEIFVNGCVEIVIFEEHAGVMISEFRIVRK